MDYSKLLKNKEILNVVEDGSFTEFKKIINKYVNNSNYSDNKLLFLFNKLRTEVNESPVGILNDDKIKGGKSDNLSIIDIVKKHFKHVTIENISKILDELKKGTSVEMEHTDDPSLAFEIATDHLSEIPDYYSKLSTIEEKFVSKAQAKYFYAKANEKGKEGKKWKKMADEFSSETDFLKLPEKKKTKLKERVIAWMDNSSEVNVKDECRLGGGKICNQGDINSLNISKIK